MCGFTRVHSTLHQRLRVFTAGCHGQGAYHASSPGGIFRTQKKLIRRSIYVNSTSFSIRFSLRMAIKFHCHSLFYTANSNTQFSPSLFTPSTLLRVRIMVQAWLPRLSTLLQPQVRYRGPYPREFTQRLTPTFTGVHRWDTSAGLEKIPAGLARPVARRLNLRVE